MYYLNSTVTICSVPEYTVCLVILWISAPSMAFNYTSYSTMRRRSLCNQGIPYAEVVDFSNVTIYTSFNKKQCNPKLLRNYIACKVA